jgi:hypothetical protein
MRPFCFVYTFVLDMGRRSVVVGGILYDACGGSLVSR